MKSRRNKKIILAILLVVAVLGVGFSAINTAYAVDNPDANTQLTAKTGKDQAKETGVLLSLATSIAAGILTLIAVLINFALDIGKEVMSLDIVRIGSQTVLSIANLGFVLAIIVIAFATILRLETYAMKQILWKLIVAALLINFSLMIAGAFISTSNIFSDFFLSKITGDNLASGLAGVLQPQSLANIGAAPSIWDGISFWFKYVVSLFFVLIFTVLIIIIFIAIFVMLLIRAVALAILLIIMPIVWLLWIFPDTVGHWKKWWTEFLRWTFFAPAMLFFIYLVVATGNNLKTLPAVQNVGGEGNINAAFQSANMLNPGFLAHVAQIIVVGGLLVGGLIVANSLSITGAKQAMGAAQGAGKMFGGWVGRLGPRAGAGMLRITGTGQRLTQGINTRIQNWQKQNPGQPLPRRLRILQRVGTTTQRATTYRAPGLFSSVWGGMKTGSGLFKGKKATEWGCRHCGNVIKSVKMPTRNCSSCANTTPDWEKLTTA